MKGHHPMTSRENHRLTASHWQTLSQCCIEYTSQWTRFKLTTLVVIGTDCTGSWKSNYRTITTTTPHPQKLQIWLNPNCKYSDSELLIDWLINWVLAPLSAVFQLYLVDQFLVVEEAGVPLGKQLVNLITGGCEYSAPFFIIYKVGSKPTPYSW